MSEQRACRHARWRRVVVRNPMETWDDRICADCGRRVPWGDALTPTDEEPLDRVKRAAGDAELPGMEGV